MTKQVLGGTIWRGAASGALMTMAVCAIAPVTAGVAAAQTVAPSQPISVPQRGTSSNLPTRQQVAPPVPTRAPARGADLVMRELPVPECPLKDSPVRVRLSAVRFEAARGGALPPAIAALLAPLTHPDGKDGDRPISDVCAIQYRANQALYAAHYVASVQVPQQEIADGVLRLSVVTARVTQVRITGASGRARQRLLQRAAAIQAMDPLNKRDVEHLLLVANDTPGQQLRVSLQPAGTAPGDVIVTIAANDQPGQILFNYQNTGSQQLGPSLLSLRGELYDLTGLDDVTYLGVSNATDWREVTVIQGGHELGLGLGGIRLGGRASYALSNPTLPGLDLRSRSLIASLDLVVPFYRALNRSGITGNDVRLWAGAGIEVLNQRTVLHQADTEAPFTRDRLRVPYLRLGGHMTGQRPDALPAFDADVLFELRRGVSILHASRLGLVTDGFQPSRLEGDPQAFEARGTLVTTLRPFARFDRLSFDLAAFGQWSDHPLLNLEEFSVGNLTYGRGYDPGANAGDRAVAIRVQPAVHITGRTTDPRITLDVFFDAVRLWNLDTGSSEADRSLRSVGGGVRVYSLRGLQIDLHYAHPLDRALTTDVRRPPDRLLLSLTTRFLPWGFGR